MKALDVGEQRRSAGSARVAHRTLEVGRDAFGGELAIPLIEVEGSGGGPTIAVDAACHGDEPEGTLAIFSLLEELAANDVHGRLVLAPALNVPAVLAMQRANPFDHWYGDMNRLFPGSADGNLTQRIAAAYFAEVAMEADYVISLHSGATYIHWSPEVLANPGDDASLRLAKSLGPRWDVIRASSRFPGSCAQACADAGKPAISLEAGGAGDRVLASYARNVDVIKEGLLNLLRTLEVVPGRPERPSAWRLVEENAIRSAQAGFLAIDPDLQLRTPVAAGTRLGRLLSFYGEELEAIDAPFDGMVMGIRTVSYAPPGWPLFWFARVVGIDEAPAP